MGEKFNIKNIKVAQIIYSLLSILTTVCLIVSIITAVNFYRLNKQMEYLENNRGELESIIGSLSEIKAYYDKYYIGEIPNDSELADYALLGFTLGYSDKYGVYKSPSEAEQAKLSQDEKLYGIGIEVVYEEGLGLYVSNVYKDSPAYEAGISIGEYIIEANGIKATDVTAQEFIDLIKGDIGTSVSIVTATYDELINQTEEFRARPYGYNTKTEMHILRDEVNVKSVSSRILDNSILYIKISKFTNYTDEEFIEKVESYKSSISSDIIPKIIIDLRNNPGGLADSAIELIDYIVPNGLIVEFKGKTEETSKEYYSDSKELNANIVVLVNEDSASASELTAKVLQDYNKAIIIGTQTFGKGIVLSTFTMRNGGSLTLSTAEYRTISDEPIDGVGVTPDIEIDLSDEQKEIFYKLSLEEDSQLQKAINILIN